MIHTDEQTITIHGAWHGKTSDPGRMFRGKIVHSNLSGVREGTNAEVTFGHSTAHAQSANEHGTYTLIVGSNSMPLMSFTCRSAGTTGQHGTNDTQEADWQAVPLG